MRLSIAPGRCDNATPSRARSREKAADPKDVLMSTPCRRTPPPSHSRRRLSSLGAIAGIALLGSACRSEQSREAPASTTVTAASQPATAQAATPSNVAAPPSASGPGGVVRVLSAQADVLQRPTTVAFRGETPWVSIGQLSALFSPDGHPSLPFTAISLDRQHAAIAAEKIELPGPDYYPEGIASASDGTLYIGSIMQASIARVPAGSTKAQPFVRPGVARRGVLGVHVDEGRQLLWFCDSNPKLEDAKKAGDVVAVRLSDAVEVVRHSLPPLDSKPPFCNDLIVSPDGSVWVTESAGGRVFRVPAIAALQPNSAETWLTGGEIAPPPSGGSGANGIEWLEGHLIVANVGRGTLVELDPTSTATDRGARTIPLVDTVTRAPVTLCSPDGVERVPGSNDTLVVVENGGCTSKAPRVVEVTLDKRPG
jgi:sugar lactone lactonase YvrE